MTRATDSAFPRRVSGDLCDGQFLSRNKIEYGASMDVLRPIQHVLCPVDFSPPSLHAFRHAAAVAGHTGASLKGLYVFNAPLPVRAAFPQYAGEMLDRRARSSLLERLHDIAHPARDQGIAVDVLIREGDVIDEVIQVATSSRADLIVLGTHGRSGVRRLMLGSVTERVLRRAPCPALSVPPTASEPSRDAAPFQRILGCLDFSEESVEAVRYALTLARAAKGIADLLHVVEWVEDEQLLIDAAVAPALRERQEQEARARLEAEFGTGDGVPYGIANVTVVYGKPYEQILEYADRARADVIAMGVGRPNLADRVMGSTTDRVVRSAGCPVLTIRR